MARRPGFSLVLALTVMALMVIVLLSLAGLLAVESRLAAQGQAMRASRLNALAAGRLALGQLQQLAGHDQRVTARADLLDPSLPGSNRNTGERLAGLAGDKRHWTGVWMTGPGGGDRTRAWDPARPDARVFLGWLVSPSPAGETLQVTPSATLTPAATRDILRAAQVPAPVTETPIPLLGAGELGPDAPVADRVSRSAYALPEGGGRIAWWTADEGVKARLNLVDPLMDTGGDEPVPPPGLNGWWRGFRLAAFGQTGAEPIDAALATAGLREAREADLRATFAGGASARDSLLARTSRRGDLLSWADRAWTQDAAARSRLARDLARSWHDATPTARGIMTNTLDGGLRVDLSVAFELPYATAGGVTGWRDLACLPTSPDRNALNLAAGVTESTEPGSSEWNHGEPLRYLFEVPIPEEESLGRARNPFTVPGPTWDVLRAHYRLYKRELEGTPQPGVPWAASADAWLARGSAPFTFQAGSPGQGATRPHPGGTPGLPTSPPALFGPKANLAALQPLAAASEPQPRHLRTLVLEDGSEATRVRELRSRLAPVVTRFGMIHSLIYCRNTLAIGLDAFLAVHNPYDVPVEFAGIGVTWAQFNAGRFNIYRADNPESPIATCTLGNDLRQRSYSLRGFHTYPVGAEPAGRWGQAPQAHLRIEPGETRILTPNLAGNRWQVYRAQSYQNISMAAFAYDLQSNFRINAHRLPDLAELRENESMLDALVAPAPGSTAASEPLVAELVLRDAGQVNAFDTHLHRANRHATSSSAPGWWAWLGNESLAIGGDHSDEHLLQRVGVRLGPDLAPGGTGAVRSQPFPRSPVSDGTRNLPDKRFFAVTEFRLRSLAEPNGFPMPLQALNPRAQLADPRNWDGKSATSPAWQASVTALSGDPLTTLQFWPGNTPQRNQASWGDSHFPGEGSRAAILYQVPRRPLLSLAQLAHADIGELDIDPGYAIGNSFAHPGLDRLDKLLRWPTAEGLGAPLERVDLAHAANRALWDRAFLSGLNAGRARADDGSTQPHATLAQAAEALADGAPDALANRRFRFAPSRADGPTRERRIAALLDPATTARQLVQEGTFNVNSTSAAAWKAQLTGGLGALAEGRTRRPEHPFSRLHPPSGEAEDDNRWNTYRSLAEGTGALDRLAEAIVAEVRARGPFMSLADFVNRRLVEGPNGRKGALQAAIDAAGLNAARTAPAIGTSALARLPQAVALSATDTAAEAPVALGRPDLLLQSDLLAAIGPHLAARSDTFVIRAFGEARGGNAWCEITVQRMPDWIVPRAEDLLEPRPDYRAGMARDRGTLAEMHRHNAALHPVNRALGRRFVITDFRWIHAP
jgi:hypothetical protein